MGKNKKRGKKEVSTQTERSDRWNVNNEADLSNAKIEKYYKAQNIVVPEEWDEFYSVLKKELPATFRITGTRTTAQDLNHVIEAVHVPNLQELVYEGKQIEPPTKLEWYPDGLAWQLNVSRTVIRRTPELKDFHNFLIYETETGSISRQEAVSMIPPLLLDVQPHHYVLDMCAAPGSKTAQLIEALHADDAEMPTSSFPSGLVIANDSDYKRANLLVHQSARLPSPAVMVTNLDAAIYPHLKIPRRFGSDPSTSSDTTTLQNLLFDRILCDVPCSGDGTIRKNLMVWRNWQAGNGNGLHSLQLRILQRAMRMLKEHGRIVYSTCSLNPVENEAVVAAALTSSRNQFKLVDVSSTLPQLKRRPGLRTWSVAVDKEMTMFDTWEQYLASGTKQGKATETMFAPVLKDDIEEDATARSKGRELKGKDLHLERCLRIYPHLQNTGGFFVAVLERAPNTALDKIWEGNATRKRSKPDEDDDTEPVDQPAVKRAKPDAAEQKEDVDLPEPEIDMSPKDSPPLEMVDAEEETPMVLDVEGEAGPAATSRAKGSGQAFKENPYTYLTEDNELLAGCLERLRIRPTFAKANLFVRNPTGEAVRSMYLCSDVVKAVVQHNDFDRIRLITCGTKVFTRQESGRGSHQFRILNDGVSSILPHIEPEAVLAGDLGVLRVLLAQFYPKLSTFEGSFRDIATEAPIGCSLVRFGAQKDGDAHLRHALVLPLWKSPASLSLMIDKKAKSALSLRLFGVDLCSPKDVATSGPAEDAEPAEGVTS